MSKPLILELKEKIRKYSKTEEVDTGETWVDGKKIYTKTISKICISSFPTSFLSYFPYYFYNMLLKITQTSQTENIP